MSSHHIVQPRVYVKVFAGLTILMILTVVAAFFNLGAFNPVVAMTIAIAKAILIVLFFMNVYNSTRLTWVFVASGFAWLLILFGLIMPDFISRSWERHDPTWVEQSVTALPAAPAPHDAAH